MALDFDCYCSASLLCPYGSVWLRRNDKVIMYRCPHLVQLWGEGVGHVTSVFSDKLPQWNLLARCYRGNECRLVTGSMSDCYPGIGPERKISQQYTTVVHFLPQEITQTANEVGCLDLRLKVGTEMALSLANFLHYHGFLYKDKKPNYMQYISTRGI